MSLARIVLLALVGFAVAEKLPKCGHHGTPQPGPTEEPASLSAEDFWEKYVRLSEPVVIRGAVKDDLGLKLWNDEYLLKNYGEMKVRMEPKDEGGQRMADMPSVDSLSKFYSKWMKGGYTVTQVPGRMNNESSIVPCMACGPIRDQFIEANLWISTGDTNSKIHKDSNNQMNCLYQGTKDWTLFAPEYAKSLYLVNERPGLDQMYDTAGFSRIQTRAVDFRHFPRFKDVPFMRARVNPGDCIYIPGTYIHHVYSSGQRNIQVSMLFAGPGTPTAMQRVYNRKIGGVPFSEADDHGHKCTQHSESGPNLKIGEVDVAWPFDGYGPITMGFSNPSSYVQEWKDIIQKKQARHGKIDKKAFIGVFVNFVNQMDPCHDKTARFSDDVEIHRHVYEALDVLYPDYSGQHSHWNGTCDGGLCQVPKLCTMLMESLQQQAGTLFDQLSKDGHLDTTAFLAKSRRQLQDALLATFVRDQIAAVFEEVSGDYDAHGQEASWEQENDGDDDADGQDDNERDEM